MDLLKVSNLSTSFFTDAGEVKAVRGISFFLNEGKSLGLVGESGCGKSVTALSLINLVPYPGRIIAGNIFYRGKDLLQLESKNMLDVRGKEIAMIFQEPLTAFNPVFSIGSQVQEAILTHQKVSKKEALNKASKLLEDVGISQEGVIENYPHQLSGGMRQRAMIAMALSCDPSLLIADEPTTALDVTIQAQVLELISEIQKKRNMSMILITHDLGIVADRVEYLAIMYCGKIVEYSLAKELISKPLHPYTSGLIDSIPDISRREKPLRTIKGAVPSLLNLPKGCSFCDRCFMVDSLCRLQEPQLRDIGAGHMVACHRV
ncbi:MAG: ABC transporter ATP-binding protein [Candidatus Omnitrophica bacterium]|nr:ABC transporter ATP-binding protein [Candidatus Omnitrophota bacterium]MDD5430543.1 ABC transporter ATP-binding protein [Candidatus Omnitrophota bacterium]